MLWTKVKDKFKWVLLANWKLLNLMRLKPEELDKAFLLKPLSWDLSLEFLEAVKEG